MNFYKEDKAIIEQALKNACAKTKGPHSVFHYQKVLQKFQPNNGMETPAGQDGFRYDYDDASDVSGRTNWFKVACQLRKE
ncbi:hypothetical protein V1502_10505 [Bacillus sp. SCS-153A]|uniref:hypothetical protein n=1 Tax=Rossellomorea sedimentorum TaxID=3115294 RepID=UPI00390677E3